MRILHGLEGAARELSEKKVIKHVVISVEEGENHDTMFLIIEHGLEVKDDDLRDRELFTKEELFYFTRKVLLTENP